MGVIKLLSEGLINQIAAGEVVERPASVVKELVENSLDAGADRITVELVQAGKTSIRVRDNGVGMSREDLQSAVMRHATSKISEESDLWRIKTMGFRGEALASISSVSKLTLKSKREEDMIGAALYCDGGEMRTIQDEGMPTGTEIVVEDLFFNTPARLKYLKKDSTELGHVTAVLQAIALAHPEKGFKVVHNGTLLYDVPPVSDLAMRIGDLLGSGVGEAMLPVFYGGSSLKIEGFIGKPVLSRSSGKHQYLFVNGRPVVHHLFFHTIKRAYHSMLMEERKPIFVLNMRIEPELIDVNVHPRKLEIRFEDEQEIFKILYAMVSKTLESTNLMPKGVSEAPRYMSERMPQSVPRQSQSHFEEWGGALKAARSTPSPGMKWEKPALVPLAQIANSYIVARNDEGLVLIDQHAAHEKVRYEELMTQFESQEKRVQPLLTPYPLELTQEEKGLLEEEMEVFRGLGFEIEDFGGSFVVQAVPSVFVKEDIAEVVRGVLDDLLESKESVRFQGRTQAILTYMSCRSAIKFGQSLSMVEMEALLLQMERLSRPFTCPHGRPTMVALTLDELARMFGRK